MKYIYLINKFSLGDRTQGIIQKIELASKKRNLDYIIEVNSETRSTEDILDKYKDSKNIIMAIGGDGIINRVLNSIYGTKNALGFIPMGTGNDFYKTCKEVFMDKTQKIDVVKINNKYFMNIACFGIDADIANKSDIIHSKIIPKKQRYNASILYHFFKYKPRKLKIEMDKKHYDGDYTTIILCNARYYGGGYKVSNDAKVDDGLLDVYMFDKMKKLNMARLILGINKGKHEKSNKLVKTFTNKMIIKSDDEFACNIDGEELKANEFKIEVIPKGIEIYFDQELIKEITN